MNVLLTGATGFIGSHVASALFEEADCTVIAIVRKVSGYKNTEYLAAYGAILKEGLCCEDTFLESIFKQYRIDYVLHLAAVRGAGKGTYDDYRKINVEATESLLDCAYRYRVKRFVFCSSVGVWGTIPAKTPPDSTTPLVPDSYYHKSKIEAEQLVLAYASRGLDAVIIRPTITYGTGDDGFPATLVDLVKTTKFIFTRREVKIHLVSVKKAAAIFVRIIKTGELSQNIILALDRRPVSLKQMADLIYEHYYGKPYPKYLQIPGFIFSLAAYVSKIIQNHEWSARFRLLSNDWYYNSDILEKDLGFQADNTESAFKSYLNSL